jgi:hypothetical protein
MGNQKKRRNKGKSLFKRSADKVAQQAGKIGDILMGSDLEDAGQAEAEYLCEEDEEMNTG